MKNFGQQETARLAQGMRPQKISICQDETFHPEPCWGAIKPVSHFILLEQYAPHRTAADWSAAMAEALADLPVQVIFTPMFICRPDGTTPTERFLGGKSADLFEWLLNHVPMPARLHILIFIPI